MVLLDMGQRITSAVSDLYRAPTLDEKAFEDMIKEICNALLEADVNIVHVHQLRTAIKKEVDFQNMDPNVNKKRVIQKAVYDKLLELVNPKVEPYAPKRGKSNVIMFVGLQGAGKTTTCTKLARYYAARGFRPCLVCADTFRAGAFDQLRQNATKAKIPYYGDLTEPDPVVVARDGVDKFKKEKFDIIIVDTSGRHRQEQDLFDEMVQIQAAVKPNQTIMVLDGSIGQSAKSQAMAFKEAANFGSIIITKTDGAAAGGGAISAVAATNTPIVFLGTGEHLGDLERFSPQSFVSKILGMGDIEGLLDHVQTMNLGQGESIKRIAEGIFTLRDLREQMSSIMKMGPLSKMAGMIPGLSGMMSGMGDDEGAAKMRRMIYIFDSMTMKELDSDGKIFVEQPSRMVRVARGSGTSVREVEQVLAQHGMMAEMAKKMKTGMQSAQKAQGQLGGKNSKQQMEAMQRRMASMGMNMPAGAGGEGGMPGLGAGGMPDMSSLMSMMGGLGGNAGGGFPGGGFPGFGGGGMPDMSQIMQMASKMGLGGALGGAGGRR